MCLGVHDLGFYAMHAINKLQWLLIRVKSALNILNSFMGKTKTLKIKFIMSCCQNTWHVFWTFNVRRNERKNASATYRYQLKKRPESHLETFKIPKVDRIREPSMANVKQTTDVLQASTVRLQSHFSARYNKKILYTIKKTMQTIWSFLVILRIKLSICGIFLSSIISQNYFLLPSISTV